LVTKPLNPIISEGLDRFGPGNVMIYIQITRGVAPRAHIFEPGMTPTVVITFRPLPAVADELRRGGVSLMTTPEIRWAKCSIKAITLLPNVLARTEAKTKGFFDALFVTDAGLVSESTAANIFTVSSGVVRMPRRTESILHGVTQSFLLDCAESIGVAVEEADITRDELLVADEVFLSGTLYEVLGVTSVDGKPIGAGTVGAATRRLSAAFRQRMMASLTGGATVCAG
jgi:D-alanine transaminase